MGRNYLQGIEPISLETWQKMKPKNPERDVPQLDLLKIRLESFINMDHALVLLSKEMDWSQFDREFGASFDEKMGRPAKSTRLMVGLTYLKHVYDLSDDEMAQANR